MNFMLTKKAGVKQKLIAIIGVFVIALIFIMSYSNFVFAKKIVTQNTQDIMPELATQVVKRVTEKVEKNIQAGESIASIPLIGDETKTFEEKSETLQKNLEQNGHLYIGLADLDGNAKFTNGNVDDVKDELHYKKALTGEACVSNPRFPDTLNQMVTTYAIPVKNNAGNIVSVLIFSRPLDEINDIIANAKFLGTGSTFLYDKEGTMIGNPDKSLVENKINAIKEGNKDPKFKSLGEYIEESISKGQGIGEYTYKDVKKVVVYETIPELGWVVAISAGYNDIQKGASVLRNASFVIGAIGMVAGVIVCVLIANNITRIIKVLVEKLDLMKDGNLCIEIDNKLLEREDEIGLICKSINSVKNSMKNMISELEQVGLNTNENSNTILNFSSELSDSMENITLSINEITEGNSKQADEISEIAVQAERFLEKLDDLNGYIDGVQKNTFKIQSDTSDSKEIVEGLENSVKRFDEQFVLFKSIVEELGNDMNSINSITNIINEISEQTNLLALNAAIEAARAGEAGKGFSVVAEEIRVLAEQSKENSDKIATIIGKSYKNTNEIVDKSRTMNEELKEQNGSIKEVKDVFGEMFNSINDVIPQIEKVYEEIKVAKTTQDNIHLNIQNVVAVSEEVSASSQEISASSTELKSGSDDLTNLSKQLNENTTLMMNELSNFKISE